MKIDFYERNTWEQIGYVIVNGPDGSSLGSLFWGDLCSIKLTEQYFLVAAASDEK